MSIHIHNADKSTSNDTKLHYLPFKIHADDKANVKDYFESGIENTNGEYTASFRGYPLNGKHLSLPGDYRGMVLYESLRPITENQERKFYVTKNFNEMTYWNWDKRPTAEDALVQALDWIDIAEVLHSPIELDAKD